MHWHHLYRYVARCKSNCAVGHHPSQVFHNLQKVERRWVIILSHVGVPFTHLSSLRFIDYLSPVGMFI